MTGGGAGRDSRRERVGRIIGNVVRQALADAGAAGVQVLEGDTPEGRLLTEWCRGALGDERVFTGTGGARVLAAHPVSKTVLLLSDPPDSPVLPLGDLYACQVQELAGGWTAPRAVCELAAAAGGLAALDEALRAWCEERRPLADALRPLGGAAAAVEAALRAQRWRRWRLGLVPKLGARTFGIDLWE